MQFGSSHAAFLKGQGVSHENILISVWFVTPIREEMGSWKNKIGPWLLLKLRLVWKSNDIPLSLGN